MASLDSSSVPMEESKSSRISTIWPWVEVWYPMNISLLSFVDELEKIAVRVPFIHGTHAPHEVLKPGIGKPVFGKSDPNPRAVYTAQKSRTKLPGIATFARQSAAAKGGNPMIAFGKMDTKKGWEPFGLTAKGRKTLGDIEEAKDLVRQLDEKVLSKAERGQAWRTLNESVGAWRNRNLSATLKPNYYKTLANLVARRRVA